MQRGRGLPTRKGSLSGSKERGAPVVPVHNMAVEGTNNNDAEDDSNSRSLRRRARGLPMTTSAVATRGLPSPVAAAADVASTKLASGGKKTTRRSRSPASVTRSSPATRKAIKQIITTTRQHGDLVYLDEETGNSWILNVAVGGQNFDVTAKELLSTTDTNNTSKSAKRTRSSSLSTGQKEQERNVLGAAQHPPAAGTALPTMVAEDGNFYYCSICKGPGDVVCCDGCPQVFHHACLPLEDPSRIALDNDVEPWYCPDCLGGKTSADMKKQFTPNRSTKRKRSMDTGSDKVVDTDKNDGDRMIDDSNVEEGDDEDEENDEDEDDAEEDEDSEGKSVGGDIEAATTGEPAKKRKKLSATGDTFSKKSTGKLSKKSFQKKRDKKEKKKKKKKKRDKDSAGASSPTETMTSPSQDEEEDPFQGLFSTATTGIIQATPAFYFFLTENRLKIERSLVRKHRYFNRLPKGMERNQLIAKEGAHWWINLPPAEVDLYISASIKDFEKRVIEWKEEKNIKNMTANSDFIVDDNGDPVELDDEELAHKNHQKLYLRTSVGAKPFKPDPEESNNRVLLELLQDMRFHPLPMIQAKRAKKEYGEIDFDKVSIPFFEVNGPLATSLGDECIGCTRGFAHFCNVLKRTVPALLNRARLQPPTSSLLATRVGLGLKLESSPQLKAETTNKSQSVGLFSVRDVPAVASAKSLPNIPFETLSAPSDRGDDIVKFVEEVVHMKVPEPPRPQPPGNKSASQEKASGRKGITSRAALPTRIRKKSTDDPSPDDVDGVTVVNKCGRCRTVIDGDTGCVQCRRAQLVINLSREETTEYSSSVNDENQDNETAALSNPDLLQVQTIMTGRIAMKDYTPQMQTEGDEAIANHILKQRWTPFAILPPQKVKAPDYDPSNSTMEKEINGCTDSEEESSSDSSNGTSAENLRFTKSADVGGAEAMLLSSSRTDLGKTDAKVRKSIDVDMMAKNTSEGEDSDHYSSSKRLRSSARLGAQEHCNSKIVNDSGTDEMEEKDRQRIQRRYTKEKDDLSRKCLSVACCGILQAMMRRDPLRLFAEPVQAQGYKQVIDHPMDFGTMKRKLLSDLYENFRSFIFDAQLLCDNAIVFNSSDSVYHKTAMDLSDLLSEMQKRAAKWMSAIKEAHSAGYARANKAELMDALERLDQLSPSSFMIKDTFRGLRKTWPEALEMLKSHDRQRKRVESDFMRTKENEVAYYGSIAIRRAAAAAAHSLAPYPDSSGTFNVVGRRSHTEDQNLQNHVADKVAEVVEPPQLRDIPNWREEMIMRVLRKSQSRRMEGMTESLGGCARSDGIRVDLDLKSVAKSVRWGRFRKRAGDMARVEKTRLQYSTGMGSQNVREQLENYRKDETINRRDLLKGETEAVLLSLHKLADMAVSVRASRIHGMGLFADQDFQQGDAVAEYIGEYVSSAVTDARERIYREERIQDYQFRVDSDLVIDATKRGGHGRYINHSCDPNCIAKIVPGERKGLKRVIIVALRDIRMMEEFSYDYQFPLEINLDARIPCNCHSEQCRGFMNWDLPEKGSSFQDFRSQKRGANMRDRIRRLGRPLKGDK